MTSKSSDQQGEERGQAGGAESLGARLRRAREARNLSLRELSDQTRITRRHLEAIEADDFKQLPGGIFNRSFVKAFAKAVGYDEEEAVRAYQRAARQSGDSDDVLTTRQTSRIYMDDIPSRSPMLTAILSLVILAIISLAAYAGLHYYRRKSEPAAQPAPVNAQRNSQTPPAGAAAQPANAAAQTAQPAARLSVQVRAKGEEVWVRTSVDAQSPTDVTLKAEQTKDVSANESLKLEYARVKAPALEVTINGRPAVVPAETKPGKNLVEMLITKEDYEKLLQRP